MAFEIIMPKLGVDMQEGEIIEWKKQEGDVVNEGDILLEIMSDKTNMELEAEDSGVLLKITRQAGETVPVMRLLVILEQRVKLWPIMLRAHQLQKLLRKLKKLLLWKHL